MRFALAFFLLAHGVAHLVGFVSSWKLATLTEFVSSNAFPANPPPPVVLRLRVRPFMEALVSRCWLQLDLNVPRMPNTEEKDRFNEFMIDTVLPVLPDQARHGP